MKSTLVITVKSHQEPKYPILGYLQARFSLLSMSSSVYSLRYQQFLKRLKAARLEAGLTQVEVAAQLQVPQSYVSKCESGERRVDVVELLNFAAIYEKPLAYFVGESCE